MIFGLAALVLGVVGSVCCIRPLSYKIPIMAVSRTKQIIKIALLVGTITSMFFVPWPLILAWLPPLPDTIQQQVEDALDHDFDGIVVYVDERGKEPQFYSAGWKNRGDKIPADPHALFKIASVGKLYDAVSVAKLVNDELLSLDKTVADYFPELESRIQYADEITLRMMVRHRSGLPNLTDTPNFWTDPPKSSEEALERVLDLPADFEPGQDSAYSNTNYLLISLLIEKVTADTKFAYIQREILKPLGLENTYGSIHEIDMDDLMSGYYVGIEEDIKTADYASMVATAEDVGMFLRALNDGSLLDGKERDIYSSIYVFDHKGLIPGYQTIAEYHEDMDAVIVQFVNTADFSGYTWSLSEIVYSRIVKIVRAGNDG